MNWLSLLRSYYGFNINSLSVTRIHFEFIFYLADSLLILFQLLIYQLRELTMNSLSVARFHYALIPFFANSLSIYHLIPEFTMNWLLIKRIHYRLITYFTVSYKCTIFSPIRCDFTIKYANSIWILYRLNDFTMNWFSREFTLNPVSVMWFIIFFGNTLLI